MSVDELIRVLDAPHFNYEVSKDIEGVYYTPEQYEAFRKRVLS